VADVETSVGEPYRGKSGAGPITRFDASDQKCHIACEVKPKDHEWGFDPDKRVDHKVQRQVDPFIIYGIDAAGQALEDAGLTEMSDDQSDCAPAARSARALADCRELKANRLLLAEKGPGRVSARISCTVG
jgi:3-oxoacyl-[acyl-carrier-protein] synthase II